MTLQNPTTPSLIYQSHNSRQLSMRYTYLPLRSRAAGKLRCGEESLSTGSLSAPLSVRSHEVANEAPTDFATDYVIVLIPFCQKLYTPRRALHLQSSPKMCYYLISVGTCQTHNPSVVAPAVWFQENCGCRSVAYGRLRETSQLKLFMLYFVGFRILYHRPFFQRDVQWATTN